MRKFLATLLVLIFIPVFVVILVVYNTSSVLLNNEEIKDSLQEVGLYEKLVPSLISDLSESGAIFGFEVVSDKEFIDTLNKTIPPKSLQLETEKTIDALFPYIKSETEKLNIEYDLNTYKKSIIAEMDATLIKQVTDLPVCSDDELISLNLNEQKEIPKCRPAGFSAESVLKEMDGMDLSEALDSEFPNKIVISEREIKIIPPVNEFELDETSVEILPTVRNYFSIIQIAMVYGTAGLAVILILIVLLRWGSVKSMVKWAGWTLLLSSILSTLAAVFIFLFPRITATVLGDLSSFATIGLSFFSVVTERIAFAKIMPQTIVIFIIGLALIIISSFIKTKPHLNPKLDSTTQGR